MARKKGPQAQEAYDYIKERILSFELPPGAPISDRALEQSLSMSRSPIREAITLLATDGLIETTDRGPQVTAMTLSDVIEICQVRKAIEVAAIRLIFANGGLTAQQKARLTEIYKKMQSSADGVQRDTNKNYYYDDLFHQEILSATGNSRLLQIFERMRMQISRFRWLNYVLPERLQDATDEHMGIYSALMNNDCEAGVSSMTNHLDRSEVNFVKVLQSPQYNPQFTIAMSQISNIYKHIED